MVSRDQEEPAQIVPALCAGESCHVSKGRKTEGVLHGNGISAPLFSSFPQKWAVREESRAIRGDVPYSFAV